MKVNTAIGGLLLDRDECFSHWTVLNVLRSLFVLIENFRQKKNWKFAFKEYFNWKCQNLLANISGLPIINTNTSTRTTHLHRFCRPCCELLANFALDWRCDISFCFHRESPAYDFDLCDNEQWMEWKRRRLSSEQKPRFCNKWRARFCFESICSITSARFNVRLTLSIRPLFFVASRRGDDIKPHTYDQNRFLSTTISIFNQLLKFVNQQSPIISPTITVRSSQLFCSSATPPRCCLAQYKT